MEPVLSEGLNSQVMHYLLKLQKIFISHIYFSASISLYVYHSHKAAICLRQKSRFISFSPPSHFYFISFHFILFYGIYLFIFGGLTQCSVSID